LDQILDALGYPCAEEIDKNCFQVHVRFQHLLDQHINAVRTYQNRAVRLNRKSKGKGWSKARLEAEAHRLRVPQFLEQAKSSQDRLFELRPEIYVGRVPSMEKVFNLLRSHKLTPGSAITPSDTNAMTVPAILEAPAGRFGSYITFWYDALIEKLGEKVVEAGFADKLSDARAEYLEVSAASCLDRLGGKVWTSLCETPTGQFEHDIVAISGRNLFLIECKSARFQEVFRDPLRAYARLLSSFRSDNGPQGGYEQALRLLRKIRSGAPVPLYDLKGNHVETLSASDIDTESIIIVTLDNFGPLGVDPSMLLRRHSDEPWPLVMHLHNLESLVMAWIHKGWSWIDLARYVSERQLIAGRMRGLEELDVAGLFVAEGSLRRFIEADADLIQLGPDAADPFQRIHEELCGRPTTQPAKPFKLYDIHDANAVRKLFEA
jgi:hypothetical protein